MKTVNHTIELSRAEMSRVNGGGGIGDLVRRPIENETSWSRPPRELDLSGDIIWSAGMRSFADSK